MAKSLLFSPQLTFAELSQGTSPVSVRTCGAMNLDPLRLVYVVSDAIQPKAI